MLAKTTVAEASQLLVIQALVPFRTHESPSSRAVVEAAPASLPFPARTQTQIQGHPHHHLRALLPAQLVSTTRLQRVRVWPLRGNSKAKPAQSGKGGVGEAGQLQAKGTPGPSVPPSSDEVTTQVSTGQALAPASPPGAARLQSDSVTPMLR